MSKVLLVVSGGIAAYKALDVISGLNKNGHEVSVILTENAKNFVTENAIGALSGNLLKEDNVNEITHIDAAQSCDLFACIPATYNIIGKFANGIADDLATSTYAAIPQNTPKLIFPAMNTVMYTQPVLYKNLTILKNWGCKVIEPDSGMLACGYEGKGKLPKPDKIIEEILELLDSSEIWHWPLPLTPVSTTNDSYSFLDIDLEREVELPIYPHVGSYGIRRRHDHHKGVDLYAPEGTDVFAVENGIVKEICPFTGEIAGYPWWNNTYGVYIQGESGICVYGEVDNVQVQEGDRVYAGDKIAKVKTVLKVDKGRPMSMLHFELHDRDHLHTKQWTIDQTNASLGLIDPTPYLERSYKHYK